VQHIVFFGSTSILQGVPLVNNAQYPGIADDLAASYKKLKSLPCDVFLAPHTGFFDLEAKAQQLARGAKPNPFIDAPGFKKFLEQAEQKFLKQLELERKTALETKGFGN
jgi:metallo-beta-lactamase class B